MAYFVKNEITKLLKTTNFKDKVMKECTELFHDKEFMTKLDENHYLIGYLKLILAEKFVKFLHQLMLLHYLIVLIRLVLNYFLYILITIEVHKV